MVLRKWNYIKGTILHVPVYDKRLSEDEGEWSDEDEENKLEELQTDSEFFLF
jgi:hypothetical protein